MSPEEQYVRDATRGLKGQVRKDTQAELLDHLTERACQLVLSGLSHEQARAQAMQCRNLAHPPQSPAACAPTSTSTPP